MPKKIRELKLERNNEFFSNAKELSKRPGPTTPSEGPFPRLRLIIEFAVGFRHIR